MAGDAVEDSVADQEVVMRLEAGLGRRVDDQFAAGQTLADVVVGLAPQFQGDAVGQEGAEPLFDDAVRGDILKRGELL